MVKLVILLFIILLSFSCDNTNSDKICYDNLEDICECDNCPQNRCRDDNDCEIDQYCQDYTKICQSKEELCADIECQFGGVCLVNNGEPFCECKDGYEALGLRCVEENICKDVNCSHGECRVENNEAICLCEDGYKNIDNICIEDFCYGITCAGHGRCIEKDNSPKCICDWGYRAADYLSCEQIDPCEYMNCDDSEICRNGSCLVNNSFCSENNECTQEDHCWPIEYNEELLPDNIKKEEPFYSCKQSAHVIIIPKSSRWRIEVEDIPEFAKVFIYDSHFLTKRWGYSPLLVSDNAGVDGRVVVEFSAFQSGEHVIVIERTDVFRDSNYKIRINCIENCNLKATRFPIVLIHGYAGSDRYFGLIDYFWKVKKTLQNLGYLVFTPQSNPVADSERRSVQVKEQLDEYLETTGARELNLIAHSQGGLDARIIISSMGYAKYIASLTTIGTPHHGIGLAMEKFISFNDFSPEYAENVFNPTYPNDNHVKYWSYSSRSCGVLDSECKENSNGEVIDVLLIPTYQALKSDYGDNDGVVPTASMVWGEHLGLLFADHFDEIGHIFDGDDEDDAFRHLQFYSGEAQRLREYGF